MQEGFAGGVYYDRDSAETAVEQLQVLGYKPHDISIMAADSERAQDFAEKTGTKAPEGSVTGGIVGGGLGAIVAGLTATGSIAAIAGTGGLAAPLVAGPLAAALAGLGVGGLAGGIIGALIGAGIPEERAHDFETGIARGGILIGVTPRDNEEQLRTLFAPTFEASNVPRSTVEKGSIEDTIAPRRTV